jgi:RNA polymerase sigma factor (sigma-70 family)
MALRRKSVSSAVSTWSVADLSALYSQERSSLIAQARRILRSDADASEIIQEAFLKFILAAPELDSKDRALAYLRTSITNLCFNQIRATGSRPNLVAIDAETSQDRINELSAENYVSADEMLVAAEDASIVREALSRLSSAQRTALVMWEVEGRSTAEIARELGTSESNVRHVVVRARGSFVRVLNEWIIDAKTGTTALEALSSSYKKAAELAKKSSKAALSLLIVLVAFLGFNSITGTELTNVSTQVLSQSATASQLQNSSAPITTSQTSPDVQGTSKTTVDNSGLTAKISRAVFAGTDKNGIPTGFTVADASGNLGSISISSQVSNQLPDGFSLTSIAMSTSPNALNALLSQSVTFNASGVSYIATPSITINGAWFALDLNSIDATYSRLADGSYLISADFNVNSTAESAIYLEAKSGLSVGSIPSKIQTSILVDSSKSRILAQAIFVNAKGVK